MLCLSLGHVCLALVFSIYAPIMGSIKELGSSFCAWLGNCLMYVPNEDENIFMGDFNAQFGTDRDIWNCLDKHGIASINANGISLLNRYTEFNLTLVPTHFQQKICSTCI